MDSDSKSAFLGISPYVDTPADLQASLNRDIRTDVAIVGGGITGLSTALALHKSGISTTVIEREFCGFGASGRNAGHLTPTICKDLPTAVMLFGNEKAAELAQFADHCVETTENMISEFGISCDYRQSGNIMAIVHPKQEARLRKAAATAESLGAKIRYVEESEMRERGVPGAFLSGVMEMMGGTLNPGKYVLGLRQAAISAGIPVYEQTAVTGITGDSSPTVLTGQGSINADKVVMASNAYTPDIGKPGHRICPLYVTLFETQPLSDDQLDAIGGWPGGEGIYTAHESMESYRLTAQRTIIGGAKGVKYFYGGKVAAHGSSKNASQEIVVGAFRDRFPQLKSLPIAHCWAGWIGMTMNFLPLVGQLSGQPSIYHSVAYNGHGVAQASAMGAIMADMILENDNHWMNTIVRKPAYLPPEPLRWLGIKSVMGVLNGMDRSIDNKARRGI
ncbi:MAG: FAD-dependent oxidoreductase [Halieaceae bacterium]|jgi:gamma-glutamylputrescine oxidase|nr:FAD-dependent oxidoreductase [Halieaceae bacterium]